MAAAGSLVARQARNRNTWEDKMKRHTLQAKRNPAPVLNSKERKRRILKAQIMRRSDVNFCEWCTHIDPREDRYQWKTPLVKSIIEDPEYVSEEQRRRDVGIPMPPIYMMEKALKEIQGERRAKVETSMKTVSGGGEKDKAEKKKKPQRSGRVDLSDLDNDFASFKGLKLPKKKAYQKRR